MNNTKYKFKIALVLILGTLVVLAVSSYIMLEKFALNIQNETRAKLQSVVTSFTTNQIKQDNLALSNIKTNLVLPVDTLVRTLSEDTKETFTNNLKDLVDTARIKSGFTYLAINDLSGNNIVYSLNDNVSNSLTTLQNIASNHKNKTDYVLLPQNTIRLVKDILFVNGEVYGTVIAGYPAKPHRIISSARKLDLTAILFSGNKIIATNASNQLNRYTLDNSQHHGSVKFIKHINTSFHKPLHIAQKGFWSSGIIEAHHQTGFVAFAPIPWPVSLYNWLHANGGLLLLYSIAGIACFSMIKFLLSLHGNDIEFLHTKTIPPLLPELSSQEEPATIQEKPQQTAVESYLQNATNVFTKKSYSEIPAVQRIAAKTLLDIHKIRLGFIQQQEQETSIHNHEKYVVEKLATLSILIKGINNYTSSDINSHILILLADCKQYIRQLIKEYGGIIQKDTGDELLAVYSGTSPVLSAVQTSYDVFAKIYELNLQNLLNLQYKASIHYGTLTQLNLDGVVVYAGNHLKVTELISKIKTDEQILISSQAYRTLSFNLPVKRLGALNIKPIKTSSIIYSLHPTLNFEESDTKSQNQPVPSAQ